MGLCTPGRPPSHLYLVLYQSLCVPDIDLHIECRGRDAFADSNGLQKKRIGSNDVNHVIARFPYHFLIWCRECFASDLDFCSSYSLYNFFQDPPDLKT